MSLTVLGYGNTLILQMNLNEPKIFWYQSDRIDSSVLSLFGGPMKSLPITTSTKIIRIFGILLILNALACKRNSSGDTKSFVGLEADVNPEVAKGLAPSFLLLQQWFAGSIPVDEAVAQSGKINYKVHQNFSDYSYSQMPKEYKDSIVKYYQQQIGRVADFQRQSKNPSELQALLKVEAAEMYDILRVLLEPGYKPKTNDLLAVLLSQPGLRNFIDRYSAELLQRLYKRPQRDLIANLDKERDNFARLLIDTYVTQSGANPKFVQDLAADCAKLINFVNALGAQPITVCSTGGSSSNSSFQLNGSLNIASAVGTLPGNGQKFANAFGGIFGSDPGTVSYAAGAGSMPQLSIFQGKDPLAGDTGGGVTPTNPTIPVTPNTPTTPVNPYTPTTPQNGFEGLLSQLFGPNWASQVPSSPTKSTFLTDDTSTALSDTQSKLPPKPSFNCLDNPKLATGMNLILCQRHFSILSSLSPLNSNGTKNQNKTKSGSSSSSSFGLTSGYNFIPVSKYFTPVQDQGSEGACTAYGLIHTIEANMQRLVPGFTTPAQDQWQAQGQEPYTQTAVSTARQRDFGGHKVGDATDISGVDAIKTVIAQGRAVFAASEVDDSWYSPGSELSCGSAGGAAGHAYSLQGFDDTKQVFIVKNSWGDSWGEYGYSYLPYRCIEQFQQGDWYDVPMQ